MNGWLMIFRSKGMDEMWKNKKILYIMKVEKGGDGYFEKRYYFP